jgi:cyclin-dependent kinase 8/11
MPSDPLSKACLVYHGFRFNGGLLSFAYDYGSVDIRKMVRYYPTVKKTPMRPVVAKSILFQLLLAVDYVHKRSITPCDIAPSNLLLMSPTVPDVSGGLKLIDFGLSRIRSLRKLAHRGITAS